MFPSGRGSRPAVGSPLRRGIQRIPSLSGILLAALLLPGCSPAPPATFAILTQPVEVTATAFTDSSEEGSFRYQISLKSDRWTVETRLGEEWRGLREDPVRTLARLREQVVWKAPYLFVREKNGDRNPAWRRDVDHVFKVETNRVSRIGTVSARFGDPGSQYGNGVFLDVYDRLEFTLLTTHDQAPGFTLVMRELEGRFVVDAKATWERGEPELRKAWEHLRSSREAAGKTTAPAARRETVAKALWGLALATYCEREKERESGLALARQALGSVEDLETELGAIVPGELAPSADPVLRHQPGLVNFFSESTRQEPPPPIIRRPPSVASPTP